MAKKRRTGRKQSTRLSVGGFILLVLIGLVLAALGRNPQPQQFVVTPTATTTETIPIPTETASLTPVPSTSTSVATATGGVIVTREASGNVNSPVISTPTQRNQTTQSSYSVTPIAAESYFVGSTVNVRSCPSTTCEIIGVFRAGENISVDGLAVGGRVQGNTEWMRTTYNGQAGYVHSWLLNQEALTGAPAGQSQSQSQGPISVPPPSGSNGVSCGEASSCSEMSSCEQAYACLEAGNGRLDRDNDGIPCEDLCLGG